MVQDVNKINDNYMECINIESVPKVEILNTNENIKKIDEKMKIKLVPNKQIKN